MSCVLSCWCLYIFCYICVIGAYVCCGICTYTYIYTCCACLVGVVLCIVGVSVAVCCNVLQYIMNHNDVRVLLVLCRVVLVSML